MLSSRRTFAPLGALAGLLVIAGIASTAEAGRTKLEITVEAGKQDRDHTPFVVPFRLLAAAGNTPAVSLKSADGVEIAAQVTRPSLPRLYDGAHETAVWQAKRQGDGDTAWELHFILPSLKAGKSATFIATLDDEPGETRPQQGFRWKDTAGKYSELLQGDRPVLRYIYEKLDKSTKERRDETIKPYHHVYGPAGDRIITKGPGGLFTHHRGLFFGFNKITHDGDQAADVWHCRNGESQQHVGFLKTEEGPVLGRHLILINWHGREGTVFAHELREMTAYAVREGTLIEFASLVETAGGEIKLDGDPQHAGFHFRASNEVADKTKEQTYYLRPDGKGKPGETRNWPAQKGHVDLDWNAMSFVLGDQRYTVGYFDHPENPKEARYSERDYGRFGSYFEYTITKDKPLQVSYRVWVQLGEATGEELARRDDDFEMPVKVTVK